MTIEPATGRLVDLTPAECWERAASRPLGRLAWTTSRGPTVIPVNFTVNGPSVLLRTSAYTEAALEADDSLVAFQVDSIDEASRTGWSVLMRGRAVRAPMSSSASEDPQPWVSGPRTLRLRIDVDEISGRKVGRTP